MSSSVELRRWAECLRTWAVETTLPKTAVQMLIAAVEFEAEALVKDANPPRRVRSSATLRPAGQIPFPGCLDEPTLPRKSGAGHPIRVSEQNR